MKKLIKGIVILVVVLIVLVVCTTLFWLGPVVKTAVETIGPQIAGVPVTVEAVHISPLKGVVNIKGLFVGNPEGFKTPGAIDLKEFKVAVELGSIASDTIVIKEILIDAPQFTYERKLDTDNIKEIQKNIKAFAGEDKQASEDEKPAEEPSEAPKEKKDSKKVIIEHLLIKDGKVLAKVVGLPAAPIPLNTIEQHDIGKEEGGTTYAEATTQILAAVYDSVSEAVAGLVGNTSDMIKDVGNLSTNDLTETGTKALKSLGGFLKKKEE